MRELRRWAHATAGQAHGQAMALAGDAVFLAGTNLLDQFLQSLVLIEAYFVNSAMQ